MDADWESLLLQIYNFLDNFRDIASSHMVDFFTHDHWQTKLDDAMARQLLLLSDEELSQMPSGVWKPAQHVSSRLDDVAYHVAKFSLLTVIKDDYYHEIQQKLDCKFINHCMKPKKCHEVERLSCAIAMLLKQHHVSKVLDIGSGKGYLSEYMALNYNVEVLGIDNLEEHTESAMKRNKKLLKLWPSISQASNPLTKSSNGPSNPGSMRLKNERKSLNSFIPITATVDTDSLHTNWLIESLEKHSNGKFKEQDVSRTISYLNRNFLLMYKSVIIEFCLVGLHACGGLSPTLLRMFTAIPNAKIVCSVGCCYHHCTEDIPDDAGIQEHEVTNFPMSQVLIQKKAKLGRNMRMVASQATSRMAELKEIPGYSLFWRALLQVILKEKYGQDHRDCHVGKIAVKCKSFTSYVRRALKKFGLSNEEISDEEILSYYNAYHWQERHIVAFSVLRLTFAQCIESLILIDRLQFLIDQGYGDRARIVRVFDPVISPRCYAIMATR
ncbi:Methyltransferase-like protein 25 [Trichoplax sp. H2]|nr:Methyltransferase-like protein 25 [Trichoplax sp. H2]|eukprot:RDD45848.1 Methyltransferase-like protein 25 [Trichoplax sp. H2]